MKTIFAVMGKGRMMMAKRIKATPIKSKTLCENCQGDNYHNRSKIKDGEPCKNFKRKVCYMKITENSLAFFDKNGNMTFWMNK